MNPIDYARNIGASAEVLAWCENVLVKKKRNQTEYEHILDYLVSDKAPKRLRKMSYEQAKENAKKWSEASQKKGRNLIDSEDDIETIHDFFDGTKIVKLKTKKAYQREGCLMHHCLGNYEPGTTQIYSYRDKKNEPHATFEVKKGDEFFQVKGKRNGPISPKYIHPILAFLKSVGHEVRPSEMTNLGYHHVDDEVEKLLKMFVDKKGKGPNIQVLFGQRYLAS